MRGMNIELSAEFRISTISVSVSNAAATPTAVADITHHLLTSTGHVMRSRVLGQHDPPIYLC